jgi:hypothetical protein
MVYIIDFVFFIRLNGSDPRSWTGSISFRQKVFRNRRLKRKVIRRYRMSECPDLRRRKHHGAAIVA